MSIESRSETRTHKIKRIGTLGTLAAGAALSLAACADKGRPDLPIYVAEPGQTPYIIKEVKPELSEEYISAWIQENGEGTIRFGMGVGAAGILLLSLYSWINNSENMRKMEQRQRREQAQNRRNQNL